MLTATNLASPGQLNAAKERWNTILDMPFPNVPPDFDENQIIQSAAAIVKKLFNFILTLYFAREK